MKIHECEWKEYRERNDIQTCELLRWKDVKLNERQLIEAIRKGDFFGIVKASIHFPENTRKKWRELNFPPLFERMKLEQEQIDEEMVELILKKKWKFPLDDQLMLTWSVKNYITPTTLIQFYLKQGAEIKIDWAIAYYRSDPLNQFIQGQTASRIQADKEGKTMKSKLHKTISNSCYGRLSMNLTKRKEIKHSNGLYDANLLRNCNLKEVSLLNCEDDNVIAYEYVFDKKKILDQIPVQLGHWILANSKLHILEVMIIPSEQIKYLFQTLDAIYNNISSKHFEIIYSDTGKVLNRYVVMINSIQLLRYFLKKIAFTLEVVVLP